MQRRSFIAFACGAAAASAVPVVFEATASHRNPAPPHVDGAELRLTPFAVDPSWIKSGTPNFRALEYARSPDGRVINGLWACDGPCTFEWTFGHDETVHLLEGEVHVEHLGRRFTLLPGSTATFQAETKATWHVAKFARKTFTLHEPGRLIRVARRTARRLGWA